jgi:hypothetical protein
VVLPFLQKWHGGHVQHGFPVCHKTGIILLKIGDNDNAIQNSH